MKAPTNLPSPYPLPDVRSSLGEGLMPPAGFKLNLWHGMCRSLAEGVVPDGGRQFPRHASFSCTGRAGPLAEGVVLGT